MSELGTNARTPTIRDVAARANVAISSVSRVLSGHPDVSEQMRVRVQAAADELGYQPDFLGKSLRSGHTRTVGFVLRDIANPLFATVARRCEQELRRAGYSMIITSSDGDAEVEAQNLELLRRRRVDGVIASLVSETAPSTIRQLEQFTVPVVLLDREVREVSVSAVLNDHYIGVRAATEALLADGHTRIALVTGSLDVRSSRERLRAVQDASAAAQVRPAADLHVFGTFDAEFAERQVRRLLKLPDPPSAILAGGVGPTVGAIQALRGLGLSLEEDVTVVALDEWPYFQALAPSIWSVARDSDEMGAASARVLLDVLDGGQPRTETITTEFRRR